MDSFDSILEEAALKRRYPTRTLQLDNNDDAWIQVFVATDEEQEPQEEDTMGRGYYDPQQRRLAPCFGFTHRSGEGYRVQVPVPPNEPPASPMVILSSNSEKADYVANCTFRLKATDPTPATGGEFSTGHALSTISLGGAKHATPLTEDKRRSSFQFTSDYPSWDTCFEGANKFTSSLTWGSIYEDTQKPMTDPVTNMNWTAVGNNPCNMDVEIARIDRGKIHEFKHFLLPVSLTWYRGDITSLSCGIVGFPMIAEELQKLDTSKAEVLCKKYRHVLKDELRERITEEYGELPRKMDAETKAFFMNVVNKHLHSLTKSLLSDCFGHFRTGDLVCSIGKIIDSNETAIAGSYSSLPGSSGSAIFCPEFPTGTYVGIQAGGANAVQDSETKVLVYPNHNLSTSTDNPAYVLAYFRDILPKLPVAVRQEARAEAFRHYLLKHLKLLIQAHPNFTPPQLDWLQWVVMDHLPKSTFGNDSRERDYNKTRLLQVSEQLLKLSDLPVTEQELEGILGDGARTNAFMDGIRGKLWHQKLDIRPWGLSARISNVDMLCHLSCEL